MQEERFEVFFQNISGLYRAVQRLRAQFADAAAKFYFDTFTHVGEYTVVFRIRGIRKLSVSEKVAQLFI